MIGVLPEMIKMDGRLPETARGSKTNNVLPYIQHYAIWPKVNKSNVI